MTDIIELPKNILLKNLKDPSKACPSCSGEEENTREKKSMQHQANFSHYHKDPIKLRFLFESNVF
jgi:hypothetical protein